VQRTADAFYLHANNVSTTENIPRVRSGLMYMKIAAQRSVAITATLANLSLSWRARTFRSFWRESHPGVFFMSRRFLNYGALIALLLPLGACMQEPSNPAQAQWLSTFRVCQPGFHAESSPIGVSGYRCVLNQ
jgi:hypothetical protein